MRLRALSMHADYACAHSGACCRAGWTIPVDPPARAAIDAHVAAGRLAPRTRTAAPFVAYDPDAPARVAFAHDAAGACVFLAEGDAPLCLVHRDAGEATLPAPCRQFPRIAVIGDGWIDLTLSHFCPTAAAAIVDHEGPAAIVHDPACGRGRTFEGLDTRGHLPPMLRHGVLHSLDSWRRVEDAAIGLLGRPGSPHEHVGTIAGWLRAIERWTPARGRLEAFTSAIVAADTRGADAEADWTPRSALADWELAWGAVPVGRAGAPPAPTAAAIDGARARLAPWDAPVGRYLAAKLVASWVPWLATRSATVARAIEIALHVLLVEAARHRHDIDREALIHAIRHADLLLVHLVEPADLVGRIEALPGRHDRRGF